MKRAWIAGGLLTLMVLASWGNARLIRSFTCSLSDSLAQAERMAEAGDWSGAGQITQDAHARWDRASDYLCTVLRHSDTDQVDLHFHEVLELIQCQEAGEYSSANAVLMEQIGLVAEMEKLNLKNLL